MNLSDVGELFGGGTGMYETTVHGQGKKNYGIVNENDPYVAQRLRLGSQGKGLPDWLKRKEGVMKQELYAGYLPWLQMLTNPTPYGQGVSNIDERVAGAAKMARQNSLNSGELQDQAELERKQYFAQLMEYLKWKEQNANQQYASAAGMGEARTNQGLGFLNTLTGFFKPGTPAG
jgi:hypothetical protein